MLNSGAKIRVREGQNSGGPETACVGKTRKSSGVWDKCRSKARGRHEVTGTLCPEEAGNVLVSVETHRKQ